MYLFLLDPLMLSWGKSPVVVARNLNDLVGSVDNVTSSKNETQYFL